MWLWCGVVFKWYVECVVTIVYTTYTNVHTTREVYANGSGLCERLWGQSFIYSQFSQNDEDRECMTLWWPEGQPNPNEEVIQRLFNAAAPGVEKSVPVALTVSLLALLLQS